MGSPCTPVILRIRSKFCAAWAARFAAIAGHSSRRGHRLPCSSRALRTAAAAVLHRANPAALDHCLLAYVAPTEPGHRRLAEKIGLTPLFDLGMGEGEGTGAALAAGTVKAAALIHSGCSQQTFRNRTNGANTMNAPTKMTAKQLTGYDRLHNARLNKGTAFTEAERSAFGLEGLLPPAVLSLELQVARRHDEIANLENDLLKYLVLSDLQARNETLYLRGPDVGSGDLHADRLYADGRRGVPEIRPYLPPAARHLSADQRARPRQGAPRPTGPRRTCASSS